MTESNGDAPKRASRRRKPRPPTADAPVAPERPATAPAADAATPASKARRRRGARPTAHAVDAPTQGDTPDASAPPNAPGIDDTAVSAREAVTVAAPPVDARDGDGAARPDESTPTAPQAHPDTSAPVAHAGDASEPLRDAPMSTADRPPQGTPPRASAEDRDASDDGQVAAVVPTGAAAPTGDRAPSPTPVQTPGAQRGTPPAHTAQSLPATPRNAPRALTADGQPVLIRVPLAVRWRDLDAFNHVNNSKYLSFLEEARLQWMLGLPGQGLDDHVAPVVAAAQLNYRRPIEWPAQVVIELFVERLGTSSVTVGHRILAAGTGEPVVYCDGHVVMVWIHRGSGGPTPLPAPVRAACLAR